MIFVLIALWSVAAFLAASDPHNPASRRLAGVAFCGGAGALAVVLDAQIIPEIVAAYPGRHENAETVLYNIQAASSVTSYYGVPYAFALFALAYRPLRMPAWLRRSLPVLLLLPILGCLLFTPWYTEMYPVTHSAIVWWAVPYLLAGTLAILTKRSVYPGFDRTHWIVCLAVLPPVLFTMIMSYLLPSFGHLRMWVYNPLLVGAGFGVFVIGLFTYGFLGVRLAIDRRRMDSTLRAVTSGSAILNHAIKNDAAKMKLFGEKIKAYAEAAHQHELLEDIRIVLASSRHIHEMISRVHQKTEDLEIRPETVDIGVVIRESLRSFGSRLESIQLKTAIPEGWMCRIDPAQVGEAIHNVVANAVEAMAGTGELTVRLFENKREWRIEIMDNGPGMTKSETTKALEPFHTTKRGTGGNFGLGLPYAYHVMRKHGGMLLLRSSVGSGTTVCLVFPKRGIRTEQKNMTAEGRDVHV